MPKRSSDAVDEPQAKVAPAERAKKVEEEDEGMGEFEDKWEDDLESESEEETVADGEDEDEDVGGFSAHDGCIGADDQSSHRLKKTKRSTNHHLLKRPIYPERSLDQGNN